MTEKEATGAVIGICTLFALQHSILVSDWAKNLARGVFGEARVRAGYRLVFTIISIVTTALAIYAYSTLPNMTLWQPPVWLKLAMGIGQVGAAWYMFRSFTAVGLWEFTGLKQAFGKEQVSGDIEGLALKGLVTDGSYRYVRHPLYLASILLITLSPDFTRNHLVLVICADAYLIIGALIEEQRLIAHFGDEYRQYMKRVPRFIPKLRK